jgi:hypothetical protein
MNDSFRGIRYLEMGVCYSSSRKNFSRCALVADDCETFETYEGQVQDSTIMKKCNPNNAPVGRCLQENKCALRETDCELDQSTSNFNSNDEACTNQRDKSIDWDVDNPVFTQFGSCKDTISGEHFCIYTPSGCDEYGTEEYATPAETLAAGVICDCSKVHVWACRAQHHTFCAVDEFSFERVGCVPNSPHVQRSDRAESGSDQLDCRLCRKSNTVAPTPAPTTLYNPSASPTSNPTLSPAAAPITTHPVIEIPSEGTNTTSNNDNITAAVIGAATGAGVVMIGVVVALVIYWKAIFKRARMKDTSSHKMPPMGEISMDPSGVVDSFEVESAISIDDHIFDHIDEDSNKE